VTWLLYAALSAIFAGLVAILGKIGVRGVDRTLATTIRALVMAAALLMLVVARETLLHRVGALRPPQDDLDPLLA